MTLTRSITHSFLLPKNMIETEAYFEDIIKLLGGLKHHKVKNCESHGA